MFNVNRILAEALMQKICHFATVKYKIALSPTMEDPDQWESTSPLDKFLLEYKICNLVFFIC